MTLSPDESSKEETARAEIPLPAAGISDRALVGEFIRRYCRTVPTREPSRRLVTLYHPKGDSKAYTTIEQRGFEVVYSLAKKRSHNIPVASWWRMKKGNWEYKHLDLSSVVDAILKHYQLKYYDPKTKKEL